LCQGKKFVKTIWVVVLDTSEEGRSFRSKFQDTLKAPLGPNASMSEQGKIIFFPAKFYVETHVFVGLVPVYPGTVVYGRALDGPVDEDGFRTADDDIFMCAAGSG
jgi:hypothetical protein